MNEPQLPSPEDILLTHAPLLRILVAALIEGTRHVQSYVLWQDEALDRTLAPALVRKGAKRFLLRRGESVSDEEVEYETDSLPNIGLAIGSQGIRIRILKSDGGSLPVPGPSNKRQLFYAQQGIAFSSGRKRRRAINSSGKPSLTLACRRRVFALPRLPGLPESWSTQSCVCGVVLG